MGRRSWSGVSLLSLIKQLLLELDSKIKFYNPEAHPSIKDGMKLSVRGEDYIFISTENSEKKIQNILLHELGHISLGHIHLDCRFQGWDRKQERDADRYMIEYRVDEWLAQYDWEPNYVDYDAFMNHFEIEYRHKDLVIEIFYHATHNQTCASY